MLRNDYLMYGDISSKDYQIGIYGDALAQAPQKDEEFISVPGRNGDLIVDNGKYKNITVTYKAYLIDEYHSNIKGFRNVLLSQSGYCKLHDTINPSEYRLAKALPFDITEYGVLRAAEFTLQFNCKPQRFLVEGDIPIEITSASSIFSPYEEDAKPLIRAYGTGSFTMNGVTVTINSANGYTDIDCDLQEAYKDTLATNCNANIVLTNGAFPYLQTGANAISLSGITKLIVYPKWWIL